MHDHRDAFTRVVTEVVTPGASEVDAKGRFPAEAIAALGRAGILGLTSAPDVATTDALLDFVGRAIAGLALLGP